MLQKIKRLIGAFLACAALMLLPSLAEARVQKPSSSFRAPHLRTADQNTWRPIYRQSSAYRATTWQPWTIRWWDKLDNHQQVDYILYGHYMD